MKPHDEITVINRLGEPVRAWVVAVYTHPRAGDFDFVTDASRADGVGHLDEEGIRWLPGWTPEICAELRAAFHLRDPEPRFTNMEEAIEDLACGGYYRKRPR